MRDYIIIGIIFLSLPIAIVKPYVGIYIWYWIAIMNPHRLTWSFAYDFPVAQYAGIATLIGFAFMRGRQKLPIERELIILIVLFFLFTSSTIFAIFPDQAWDYWQQVMKIMLMTILTVWLIDSREKLRILLFVITLSLGFFAIKGALWGIASGGQFLLYGPMGSFIASNNAIGLALNMMMPLMLFFARSETDKRVKLFYYVMFLSSIMGVILTYSRGAFLGLVAVIFFLLIRSKKKYLAIPALVICILITVSVVPSKWFSRIESIETYEEDESATSRIETWKFAWNLALKRPFTGGGFHAFQLNPTEGYYAHSVYFGIIGEQGFIALGVFLLLMASSYWSLFVIKKNYSKIDGFKWYADLASMLQVGFIGFLVNGLTLGKQYFDMIYLFVALVVIIKTLLQREIVLALVSEIEFAEGTKKVTF